MEHESSFFLWGQAVKSRWAWSLGGRLGSLQWCTVTKLNNESGSSYKTTRERTGEGISIHICRGDTVNPSLKLPDNTCNTSKLEWDVLCQTWVTLRNFPLIRVIIFFVNELAPKPGGMELARRLASRLYYETGMISEHSVSISVVGASSALSANKYVFEWINHNIALGLEFIDLTECYMLKCPVEWH